MLDEKQIPGIPVSLSVTLTGRGLELINKELVCATEDLPEMPLALADRVAVENDGGDLWVVAQWQTSERVMARAMQLNQGEHALLGPTVTMSKGAGQEDDTTRNLIVESAKGALKKAYGLEAPDA